MEQMHLGSQINTHVLHMYSLIEHTTISLCSFQPLFSSPKLDMTVSPRNSVRVKSDNNANKDTVEWKVFFAVYAQF